MKRLIGISGDVAAVAGILLCIVSGAARILGHYDMAGTGTIAVFTLGIGLMVFGCLTKLHLLTTGQKGG